MYARLSSIMFPIAAILFVGAIIWGYQEHQEKNAVLIKAENQYQRAFHELSNHMGRLHDELGQTLAVSSSSQGMQRKGLVNVWRLTSEAQNEINQLPLTLLPFNKAEQFLARISNFAYRTAIRDLTKQPLSPAEMNTMKSLYTTSESINKDINKVQDAVISDRLRWMDVEVAIASENSQQDNSIIDGFKTVHKKMGAYPESDWGPSAQSTDRIRSAATLEGGDLTAAEVKQKAINFLGNRISNKEINVTMGGQETDLPIYSVSAKSQNGPAVQMDYTVKGGHLLWYMNTREVKSRMLNFDTARHKASQFLVRHQYRDMTPINYDEYDHVAVFTYAQTIENVKVYSDKVTVRVALDNGEVVGLQARDHVFAKKLLTTGKPKMTKVQAQKGLNTDFRVENYDLAVIENEMRQLVLCHEFVGKINDHHYRIFMNAETGLEESIEQIPEAAKTLVKG